MTIPVANRANTQNVASLNHFNHHRRSNEALLLTTEYPAIVGNSFLRIRRSLKINAQLNQER